MYVIDGIAYAGEPKTLISVKSVRPMDNYKLWVRFTNNEEKLFNFAPLLDAPCYRPLKDKALFDKVYVDYGCPAWNDGDIDIAPELLYSDGVPVGGNPNV